MTNKMLLSATALLAVALEATAALPDATIPTSYGSLRSRSLTLAPTQPLLNNGVKAGKGSSKISAYTDASIADVEKYGELVSLIEEDFSLLTTGSEAAPDKSVDLEIHENDPKWQYPWNNMNTDYTHGDLRWGCHTAYPAGGCLYFALDQNNYQGNVVTPIMNLSDNGGVFVLEFRARLEKAQDPEQMLTTINVQAAETYNWSPRWDDVDGTFTTDELTTEWRTFRLIFQGGGTTTLCNIVAEGINGGVYVDDIKLYSLKQHVGIPVMTHHSNFAENNFNINWRPVDGAESYAVNVWYLDEETGSKVYVANDAVVAAPATTYQVEGTQPDKIYYADVAAKKGAYTSVASLPNTIFGIAVPKMKAAQPVGTDGITFKGGVEEQECAYGFSYMATAKRTAEADGPFVVTREEFTGWKHPLIEGENNYTKENPFTEGVIGGPYYPTDIKQQGWYGQNYMTYKDYLMLAPFFYTATGLASEQACWTSPQFDLSKDGGKVTVDLSLAADLWEYYDDNGDNVRRYADAAVALFNWDDEAGDYVQADAVYFTDLKFDWQQKQAVLNGATSRSTIAIFGINSYNDMYVDDIVVTQNYKKGETFRDPFYYRTWQLAEDSETGDKTSFQFTVPDYASGAEVDQRAFAARVHFNEGGELDNTTTSLWADYDYVGKTDKYTGIGLVKNELTGSVRTANGTIFVSNPDGMDVSVVSIDGKSVKLGNANELTYAPGTNGVYVVRVGNSSIKIAL